MWFRVASIIKQNQWFVFMDLIQKRERDQLIILRMSEAEESKNKIEVQFKKFWEFNQTIPICNYAIDG